MGKIDHSLPGADIVLEGLGALRRGDLTVEALLVAIGAPRLRRSGMDLPAQESLPTEPELTLYRILRDNKTGDSYSRYNALIRRLVSFEQALESSRGRRLV